MYIQEDCLVRYSLGSQWIRAVCCGKRNATAAQEPASITIIIRWLGCCSLSALRVWCLTSCVVWSAGSCTWEDSVKAMFQSQDSQTSCTKVEPVKLVIQRLRRRPTSYSNKSAKCKTTAIYAQLHMLTATPFRCKVVQSKRFSFFCQGTLS